MRSITRPVITVAVVRNIQKPPKNKNNLGFIELRTGMTQLEWNFYETFIVLCRYERKIIKK